MRDKSIAVVVGNVLLYSVAGEDWHFFIRSLDAQTHASFSDFHKKGMSPANVAKFLPNWKTLKWTRIKNSILGRSESYAKDVEFEVNVYATEKSEKKHQEVIDLFLAFMRNH